MRRSRISPTNPARKARELERNFGRKAEWIRTLDCDTCEARAPSDPSHYPPKRRQSGQWMLPQCRDCHIELGGGEKTFQLRRSVCLVARTLHYHARWLRTPWPDSWDLEC